MEKRIRELCEAINAIVDAADFDCTYYAEELEASVGAIMCAPEKTPEQVVHYESEWKHAGLLGFLDMSRKLNGMGFMYCGHGCFSSVFKHSDTHGVVYKLSMRTDDAYAAFALWARAHPNQHAPVLYSIQRGQSAVVFAIKEYVSISTAKSSGQLPTDFVTHRLMQRVYANNPNTLYRSSLVKYLREIRQFFKGVAHIDIHAENLMFDPDIKRIIVTDPVSSTNYMEESQCYSTT